MRWAVTFVMESVEIKEYIIFWKLCIQSPWSNHIMHQGTLQIERWRREYTQRFLTRFIFHYEMFWYYHLLASLLVCHHERFQPTAVFHPFVTDLSQTIMTSCWIPYCGLQRTDGSLDSVQATFHADTVCAEATEMAYSPLYNLLK